MSQIYNNSMSQIYITSGHVETKKGVAGDSNRNTGYAIQL